MTELTGAQLVRRLMLIDTHIDVPYRLECDPVDLGRRSLRGDFDYPRAVEGGLDAAFVAVYVPSEEQEIAQARPFADRLIDRVEGLVRENPDKFELVTSAENLTAAVGRGKIALALGLENGAPLGTDSKGLEHFHARGVRYVTLTHARPNQICDSSYAEERPWNGLSSFGRELIPAMNAMGMMVDVSHVSDAAFEQVVDISTSPVVATHSSCRHFTPGWERNLSDEMIHALAATGGLVQVTFGSSFLRDDYRLAVEGLRAEVTRFCAERGLDESSSEADAFLSEQKAERPLPLATVEHVVDHIDHVVGLVGIEHVGLGSDFDGVGDSTPLGLRDVSGYPNLLSALVRRGYTLADLEKICAGNLLRVWREIAAGTRAKEDCDG